MSHVPGRRTLRRIVASTGAALVVLSALLILDGIIERGRAAGEAARIAELEERQPQDAAVAQELEAERERQTARSTARQARLDLLGYLLLAAAVVFFAAAKWRQTLRTERLATVTLRAAGGRETRLGGDPAPAVGAGEAAPAAAAPEEVDLDLVDRLIARHGTAKEATIPILQELQQHFRYLPEPALRRVCRRTDIAPADIIGVASFYTQLRRKPIGLHLVRVCHGTACHVAGVGPIMDELRRRLAIAEDQDTDPRGVFTLDPVNCLGCCSLAPVLMLDDTVAGHLTPTSAAHALHLVEAEPS